MRPQPAPCQGKSWTAAFGLPRLVEVVVKPAEHLGGAVDEVEIGLGVDAAEELARVLEDVDVADLAHPVGGDQGALEGLTRADVARARGGGKDKDAVQAVDGRCAAHSISRVTTRLAATLVPSFRFRPQVPVYSRVSSTR
jgi:hypothetical protein